MRYLLIISMITGMTLTGSGVQAQDTEPGLKREPDEKWDVKKEYDEHGNLIYYDSSYSRTWKHFDFPGFEDGYPFGNVDSLFGQFEHHPFGPYGEFMDSLDLYFYFDSSFFHKPYGFNFFKDFSDSSWKESFFPDSLFPDASMPFEEFFPPDHFPFHPQPFGDPHEFFKRHRERMEKFRKEFAFPYDSLHYFHPDWQQLPRHQKKSAREIEI